VVGELFPFDIGALFKILELGVPFGGKTLPSKKEIL
jgi:hypothetical protein